MDRVKHYLCTFGCCIFYGECCNININNERFKLNVEKCKVIGNYIVSILLVCI